MRLLIPFSVLLVTLAGCASSDPVTSRQAGQELVCHKNEETLKVSNASLIMHLEHNDKVGPCANGK